MNELRKALCNAAGVETDAWKVGAMPGLTTLMQKMIAEAESALAVGCELAFKSHTQATWVANELRNRNIWVDIDPDKHATLLCRWSEFSATTPTFKVTVETTWDCWTSADFIARAKQSITGTASR